MSFDEISLPEYFTQAAQGGPGFNTVVVVTKNGNEQRIGLWPQSRQGWTLSFDLLDQARVAELISFFYARQGKLRGFRFKDWLDYRATDAPQTVYDTNKIQLYKRYTSLVTYDRKIVKPVAASLTLKRNGTAYTAFTFSTSTGIVTLSGAVDGAFTASFEFDIPVRFDSDGMDAGAREMVRYWDSVGIVELLI